MSSIEAYPLTWPDGWPRRQSYQRGSSDYKVTFTRARDDLLRELTTGRARHVIISSNVPLRRDGLPLAGSWSEPRDPGVAVYWDDRKGNPKVIACDVWRTTRENLRAVGLAYASIRQIERTGASELLERAFAGFARLPSGEGGRHWSEVLGLPRDANRVAVLAAYHELARIHHPDRGGNAERMIEINRAFEASKAGT